MVNIKKKIILSFLAIPTLLGALYFCRQKVMQYIYKKEMASVYYSMKQYFKPEQFIKLPNTKELNQLLNSENVTILITQKYCYPCKRLDEIIMERYGYVLRDNPNFHILDVSEPGFWGITKKVMEKNNIYYRGVPVILKISNSKKMMYRGFGFKDGKYDIGLFDWNKPTDKSEPKCKGLIPLDKILIDEFDDKK